MAVPLERHFFLPDKKKWTFIFSGKFIVIKQYMIQALTSGALGYLVSAIKKSKGGQQAGDELSTAIWEWIRPIFLKDDEPLEDLKKEPDSSTNQHDVGIKIQKYLEKNPDALSPLKDLLDKLEKGGEKPASVSIIQTHSGSGDNVGGDKNVNSK